MLRDHTNAQVDINLSSNLGSKSAWVLNCGMITERIKKSQSGTSLLFATRQLNHILLTKQALTRDDSRRSDGSPVGTKLYVPIDIRSRNIGSWTIMLHSPKLPWFLDNAFGIRPAADALARDLKVLVAIDELPSLEGFLLRDALSLRGFRVENDYFDVSPEDHDAIQKFIRSKIELLVRAAVGGAKTDPKKVSQLIDKVWEAKDLRALEPLIVALRCPYEEALSIFAAWKGLMFYSFDYFRSEEQRTKLGLWLKNNGRLNRALQIDYAQYLQGLVQEVVMRFRHHWTNVDAVLKEYNRLYNNFVTSMEPSGFINFLRNAQEANCSVGISLGKISQAVACLEVKIKSRPDGKLYPDELPDLLNQLNAALVPT